MIQGTSTKQDITSRSLESHTATNARASRWRAAAIAASHLVRRPSRADGKSPGFGPKDQHPSAETVTGETSHRSELLGLLLHRPGTGDPPALRRRRRTHRRSRDKAEEAASPHMVAAAASATMLEKTKLSSARASRANPSLAARSERQESTPTAPRIHPEGRRRGRRSSGSQNRRRAAASTSAPTRRTTRSAAPATTIHLALPPPPPPPRTRPQRRGKSKRKQNRGRLHSSR